MDTSSDDHTTLVRLAQQYDLNQLAVFVRVAQRNSFSQAARDLGMQRSAVSRKVAALEEALGVPLLLRSTRRVEVTTAGRRLLAQVAPLLDALDGALRGLPERSDEPAGRLRLTAPTDVGLWLLPRVLTELVRRHPRLEPDVHLTNRFVDLEGEGFDVALRVTMRGLEDSALRARRLGTLTTALFAAPSYLDERGVPADTDALAEHTVVQLGGDDTGRAVRVDDMALATALVREGAGLGRLPTFYAAPAVRAGALVQVLPDQATEAGALYAVFPSAPILPAKTRAFRDAVMAFLEEEGW